MSPTPARAETGVNFIRWEARFEFYRDSPSASKPDSQRRTSLAASCWLYIFNPYGPLLYEVYVDDAGKYHEVDLTKHVGKDVRPYALEGERVRSSLPLIAGQRTTKGTLPIFHWILPSPFQLPWSRFPHISQEAVAGGAPAGNFRTWAEATRDLEHFVPEFSRASDVPGGDPGKPLPEVTVTCPWLHAYALNRCFQLAQERWVSGFLNDPKRIQRKTLRSYVRSIESIVGKERFHRDLFDILDESAFTEEERKDKEQEDFDPEELVKARAALVVYLKGTRFSAMREDALASPDPRAKATFAEIQGNSDSGLEGVGGDPKYMESVCKANGVLFELEAEELGNDVKTFLDKHPEALYGQPASLGWKEQRKAVKSYWYLVKAYIAQIEWIAPRKVTRDLKAIGRMVFGVLVDFDFAEGSGPRRMPDGTIKWPRLVVSPEAKARLAEKYSKNAEWNHFFLILDAYNLIRACQDQAKGKTDMKPVVAAMSSFLNTAASTVEAAMQRHGTKHLIVTNKMLAELAEDAGKSSGRGGTKNFAAILRKLNQPKTIAALGKVLGAVGSFSEFVSAMQKADAAQTGHDDESAAALRVSAAANITVSAGYFIGCIGTVAVMLAGSTLAWPLALVAIGSWLVAGGTITDLGAKLYLAKVEKDPLENWMKSTPWARSSKYRSDNFDELVRSFYKALVGLRVNIRTGLTGFDVTVESRVVQSPEQIFLGVEWVSDAGRFKNPIAPMNASEQAGPNQFKHQEFTSTVKELTAQVRLLLDGEWYPDEPVTFRYPS